VVDRSRRGERWGRVCLPRPKGRRGVDRRDRLRRDHRPVRSDGVGNEARELVAGIYGWFTEGFDTVDLVEAKALLEKLE
jgi:hypothetical protein